MVVDGGGYCGFVVGVAGLWYDVAGWGWCCGLWLVLWVCGRILRAVVDVEGCGGCCKLCWVLQGYAGCCRAVVGVAGCAGYCGSVLLVLQLPHLGLSSPSHFQHPDQLMNLSYYLPPTVKSFSDYG